MCTFSVPFLCNENPPFLANFSRFWPMLSRFSANFGRFITNFSHLYPILAKETHLFFARQKKGFSFFFLGGDPVQNRPQNPAPASWFSLLERVDLRSQKEGILGKRIAWGRVGWTEQKKRKKDAHILAKESNGIL